MIAGPNGCHQPGDTLEASEIGEAFANELVRGKYAEIVPPVSKAEPAAMSNPLHVDRQTPQNALGGESAAVVSPENASANPEPAPKTVGRKGKNGR